MSNEMKTTDGKDASLHGPILNNPEAVARSARRAVIRAVSQGLSREDAKRLYTEDPEIVYDLQ